MVDASYRHCFESASAAAGRDLSDTELEKFFERAQGRISRYMREGATPRDAAQRAGQELGQEVKLAAAIQRRSDKLNLLARKGLQAREIPEREADSVMAAVTGIEKQGNVRGAADSADALGQARVNDTLGGMTKELSDAGLLDVIMKGNRSFDRDFANELGRLEDPMWGEVTGNKFAAQAAKIINKWQDSVRIAQNDAGAWIGKEDHYITRQSHDAEKIRSAPFAAWRDFIAPKLDERTFQDLDTAAERDQYLHSVYNALGSGVHEGSTGSDWLGGFKGPSNLAKKASQERKLHFKSADDWFDYDQKFGHSAVRSSVFKGIEHGARNAGIMSMLGTNPEAMLNGWVDRLATKARDRGDLEQAAKIQRESGKYSGILDYAMRKGAGTEVPTFTKVMATMRSIQDFKLGGFLSYISDIQTIASAARHSGIGLFESYGNQIAGLLPKGADRAGAAMELGQGFDHFTSGVVSRMRSYDGTIRGKLASAASTFEKWNGVKWWVDHQKSAFGTMLSSNLARNAGKEFEEMPKLFQTTLRRYSIEKPEWDVIRQMKSRVVGSQEYVFPADAIHLTDEQVKGLGAASPDQARMGLKDKLSTYISSEVRTGMSEPTAGISRAMMGDKAPATVKSELFRSILQFKTFPMTHVMRSVTRELFRDGVDAPGIAKLIAGTSLLGYASYALKSGFRAQVPAGLDSGKGILEGMAQGGGLGLYGDFLFGQTSRFGGGPLEEALGPTFSSAAQLVKMFADDREDLESGKAGKLPGKLAAQTLDLAKANTPGINLFYARAALDYGVLYSLQELLNPGYLKRYEKSVQQDQGKQFILAPTSGHLHTLGK